MLSTYDTCALKYRETMEDHWSARFRGGALGYGQVVHEGLRVWYEGMMNHTPRPRAMEQAVQAIADGWPQDHPTDDFRTLERAQRLLLKHIETYPIENFTVLAVETPFLHPLGAWLDCQHSFVIKDESDNAWKHQDPLRDICPGFPGPKGNCDICGKPCEPIEYGGIYDLLVQFGQGQMSTLYVVDHKTTSQLGPTFFLQFKPNNQITGYCWGAEQMSDRKVAGAIINALCTTISGNMSFKRDFTNRDAADYAEFKTDVVTKCNMIVSHRLSGIWPKSTDQCQGKYGMCAFHSVHVLSDESERKQRRETDYVKRVWDFENRDGEPI